MSEPPRERFLRSAVVVLASMAIVASVVALLPGVEYYEDANSCAGKAFANRASDIGIVDCDERWELVRVDRAGGWAAVVFFAGAMLPGLLLFCRPRIGYAWLWAVLMIGGAYGYAIATFKLHFSTESRTLWPAEAIAFLSIAITIGIVIVVPVGASLMAAATRPRPAPLPVFPRARVVRTKPHDASS